MAAVFCERERLTGELWGHRRHTMKQEMNYKIKQKNQAKKSSKKIKRDSRIGAWT